MQIEGSTVFNLLQSIHMLGALALERTADRRGPATAKVSSSDGSVRARAPGGHAAPGMTLAVKTLTGRPKANRLLHQGH
jgi:hypothetical protein